MPVVAAPTSGAQAPAKALWTIGRTPDNDIVLADPTVSRHHAELRFTPTTGYELRDLQSHNGTFVNGQHITVAHLQGTDLVSIGNRRLHLVHGVLQEFSGEDTRLEVDNVTVRTPDNRVLLDHVSFALDANCFLAVVGPSGAGKTTLVNAMTGFRPADEGTVFYGDRDLYAEYDDLRRGIGYVPQDDILHTQLTVRQALEFTAELRFPEDVTAEERGRRVTEVINELGLSERANLVIEHLSGGQRKRANIGVELLTKPSPLFLDEPTSGLDPGLEKGVMTMLRGLADGGRTIITVTHSEQSLQLCDRLLILAPGGRTAYFGPPDGALKYFGKADLADVFTDLEQHSSVPWDEKFRASPEYDMYVRRPMSGHTPAAAPPPLRATPTRPPGVWRRQTWTLLKRYVAATASDRRNLILLLIQAPLLAILMLAALGSDSFSHPNVLAQMVVTVAVLTVTLTGLLNSIREIVKEFPIYQRERFVGTVDSRVHPVEARCPCSADDPAGDHPGRRRVRAPAGARFRIGTRITGARAHRRPCVCGPRRDVVGTAGVGDDALRRQGDQRAHPDRCRAADHVDPVAADQQQTGARSTELAQQRQVGSRRGGIDRQPQHVAADTDRCRPRVGTHCRHVVQRHRHARAADCRGTRRYRMAAEATRSEPALGAARRHSTLCACAPACAASPGGPPPGLTALRGRQVVGRVARHRLDGGGEELPLIRR